MRYVTLNQDGTISASYNDDTVNDLPAGAVELSEGEWNDRLQYRRVGGQWVEIPKQEKEKEVEVDNG